MTNSPKPPDMSQPPETRWVRIRRMVVPLLIGVLSSGGMLVVYELMEP